MTQTPQSNEVIDPELTDEVRDLLTRHGVIKPDEHHLVFAVRRDNSVFVSASHHLFNVLPSPTSREPFESVTLSIPHPNTISFEGKSPHSVVEEMRRHSRRQ